MCCAERKCKREQLGKRLESLLHWQCFVERCAVPPLAAALGFSCEGLTTSSTERCAMLKVQCSAGHCVMLRAVQPWALCSAGCSVALRAVWRCALYMRCAESKCKRANLRTRFVACHLRTSLTSAARFGSRGLPPPNPRFPLRSAFSCGGLAAASKACVNV